MKILLDTHIALWAISDDPKLSQKARELISNRENKIYYSTASVWETTIKHMAKPNMVYESGKDLAEDCNAMGYKNLPIYNRHISYIETLKFDGEGKNIEHHDPFDRILIAQAKAEGMVLISSDSKLPYYHEECIMTV
jgi:PIN domain nuclease of toxin-antitoxin system